MEQLGCMSKIYNTTYKGVHSLSIENEFILLTVLPAAGSKIASIIYKPLQYELLWQNPGKTIAPSHPQRYTEYDSYGWDEMFPSILPYEYLDGPLKGVKIPDHGELWCRPWEYRIDEETLSLHIKSGLLPCEFCKKIRLENEQISIKYALKNNALYDLDCLWAAHPLFNVSRGSKMLIPSGMSRITNSIGGSILGESDTVYDFPMAALTNGHQRDLSCLTAKKAEFKKYYFSHEMTQGWCGIVDPTINLQIKMYFPVSEIPYLGIWLNESGWAKQYNLALEPATAAMDRIDRAKVYRMFKTFEASKEKQWYLNLEIKPGALV
jgi:hypothetical protein